MKQVFKHIVLCALAITGFGNEALAQNSGPKSDAGRISLTAYIDPQVEKITEGSTSILSNKLNQIINANGLGSAGMSRFIITANVNVLSKDVVATAPPSIAYTLDVTLYIGDGMEGNKFASHSLTLKGVGMNENKAMIEAFKSIKPADKNIQAFITNGKNQVVNFYNTRCDQIMKEAKLLEAQNKFEEAIWKLTSVPDASLDCYNKAIEAIVPIYRKFIDRECKIRLQEATAIWNANQNVEAANAAGEILQGIDPTAACYKEVQAFSDKIAKRVLELDGREWKYMVDSTVGLKRDMIQAYRDVGVAYGNGQPKTMTYNVFGWW